MPTRPLMPNTPSASMRLVTTSQPTTIQEAKASGVGVGDVTAAPLAAAKGPIDAPPESLVVVTVKNFFDTPTWKAIKTILIGCASAIVVTLGATFISVWMDGKSIFDKGAVDWRNTERVCEIAGGMALMTPIMAKLKKTDNNPTES